MALPPTLRGTAIRRQPRIAMEPLPALSGMVIRHPPRIATAQVPQRNATAIRHRPPIAMDAPRPAKRMEIKPSAIRSWCVSKAFAT